MRQQIFGLGVCGSGQFSPSARREVSQVVCLNMGTWTYVCNCLVQNLPGRKRPGHRQRRRQVMRPLFKS
jgi:hypothetical protein